MNEVEAVARAIFQRQYGDRTDAVWAEMWKWWNDPDVISRGGPSEIVDSARAAIQALDEARGDGWRTIESAPRDCGIDLWCIPPDDADFVPEQGGVRLCDASWHEADEIFPHTGWVRLTDDGDMDLIDAPPTCALGLPRWVPTHWRPLPPPPGEGK